MVDILQPKNSLTVIRGESKTLKLSITKSSGSPVNLTGGRLIFTVKPSLQSRDWLIQKTSDSASQIQITSVSGGTAEIYLRPADTKTLDAREYIFDVWLVFAGEQYPVIRPSTFDLQLGVTVL